MPPSRAEGFLSRRMNQIFQSNRVLGGRGWLCSKKVEKLKGKQQNRTPKANRKRNSSSIFGVRKGAAVALPFKFCANRSKTVKA